MRTNAYSNNASKIRNNAPLLDAEILKFAPSVFAESKHQNRSDRYSYIPTINVINELRKEGFDAFEVSQSRTRNEGMENHTKHLVRMRKHQDIVTDVGEGRNELVIINSHNGSSQWHMMAGYYRLVCANGLILGENNAEIKIRHNGNPIGRVIEGAYSVVNHFSELDEHMNEMKALTLQDSEIHEFAKQALALKYPENAPFEAEKLLAPRRFEDANNTLWQVYNRVQENILRGGVQGRNATGRAMTTRAITNIDKDINFNKQLWNIARGIQLAH
jgi:hypothetical protein